MPRSYPHSTVVDGRCVGYSLKKRADETTYFVYFRDPMGRRLERDTNHSAMNRAQDVANALIAEEYAPEPVKVEEFSWDEATQRMKERALSDGRRAPTIDYYEKLVRRIRNFYPETKGPSDISPEMAEAWKKSFSMTTTRRKKFPSPHSVFSLIRGFHALWRAWFVRELGICKSNPWENVTPPKTDKPEVRVIDDDVLVHFLSWIDAKYSGWQLPRLFIETKAMTGCRLMDLCTTESSQLRDGRVFFKAEQTKGRKARSVPLPADLFARLEAIKGPTYLWESYPEGILEAVQKMGVRTHQIKPGFVPQRLYHWIETLFIDYGKAHPAKPAINSHQLRKRAFTAAWEHGIDPRKAAIAIGCNADTVMKHYVQMDEQQVTDDVMNQLAERLATKK